MRVFRLVLINAAVLALLVLALEAGARLVLWRSPQPTFEQGAFGYNRGGYGDLLPNLNSLETIYALRPYRLVTNSAGLRNTEELNDDPAVTRILAIGDSFTYGFYVHNEEAYPARLEEVLEQTRPGRYQVLNAGVPGYTLADELAYLKEKGLALEPDLVVLGFYTNDIFDYLPVMRQYFAREALLQAAALAPTEGPFARSLRQHSALYNGLLLLRGQLSAAQIAQQVSQVTPTVPGLEQAYHDITFLKPQAAENLEYWQAYARDLRDMAALLAERNVPLVLVAFPDLNQFPPEGGMPTEPQAFLRSLTAELGIAYLDLLPIFREAGDIQSLYLMYHDRDKPVNASAPDAAVQPYTGDGHLSMYGHLVTARAVAQVIAGLELE